jgi:thioredoxin-like negative regulator of GroEL
MSVERLSKRALQKILSGKIKEDAICVVKFYSNNCRLCKNLRDKYEEIANQYDDVYFFAFNIKDYPKAEKILNFSGVPTISLIKTGGYEPKIRILEDPKSPHENMWYDPEDIIEFIEKEK